MNYPKFIQQLISKGVSIELTEDGYDLSGFYKNGTVTLIPMQSENQEIYELKGRYGSLGQIVTYKDLVKANYVEWIAWRNRFEGWANPEDDYLEDMIQLGLVKKVVSVTYEPQE